MSRRSRRDTGRTAGNVARALADLLPGEKRNTQEALLDAAIRWMADHGLSREIRRFPRTLRSAWHERMGTVPAVVSTPSGDIGQEHGSMTATLKNAIGKEVALEERADATLIGGLTVSLGDERLDASLRRALSQLRTHLVTSEPASLAF